MPTPECQPGLPFAGSKQGNPMMGSLLLAAFETFHGPDDQHEGQRSNRTHAGMGHRLHRQRLILRSLLYRLVELGGCCRHLIEHAQQLLPPVTGPRTQRQALHFLAPFHREQLLLAAHALAHRECVQLILHRSPHPHQLLPVPDQLPQIPLRRRWPPDLRKSILAQQIEQMHRVPRASVFCLRTTDARIFAASPVHSSCPNSASRSSNQCVYPVASIPTRTGPCSPL
jgi:hypothetical protein